MPVYNRKAYLGEAVESVLGQSYTNFELILADDGSTDGSGELIREYARRDRRIRPVFLPHQGIPRTSNAAAALARGSLIARQDSDDIALQDRLAIQLQWLQEKNVAICGCQIEFFKSGTGVLDGGKVIRRLPEVHEVIVREMMFQYALLTGTLLMRADVCKENPFNEAIDFIDTEWPLQMALKYTMGNVPQVLIKVRLHGMNTTEARSEDFRREGTKARFKYFYSLFPHTPLPDYMAYARLADGMPMTSLRELERAGRWLVELARYPDEAFRRRMAQRWRVACDRSAALGEAVSAVYRRCQDQMDEYGKESF